MSLRIVLVALFCLLVPVAASGCEEPVRDVVEGSAEPPAAGTARLVEVDELHAVLDQVAFLVDVRTPGEFESGHIPGATNIPMADLETRLAELEAHRASEIFLVCHSGGRSARAAEWLSARGFRVVDVAGGTSAWSRRGYPTRS